jgi:hypothetical protein
MVNIMRHMAKFLLRKAEMCGSGPMAFKTNFRGPDTQVGSAITYGEFPVLREVPIIFAYRMQCFFSQPTAILRRW